MSTPSSSPTPSSSALPSPPLSTPPTLELPSLPSSSSSSSSSSSLPAPASAGAPVPTGQRQPRNVSPPTEPRASRLARVAEEVVAALEARRLAMQRGAPGQGMGLNDEMLRGSMRVLDDIIQESAATNASYNAGRWAGRGNR